MAELTPQAVEELFGRCHDPLAAAASNAVEVDTVAGPTWLDRDRIAENRDAIRDLLAELPDQFKLTGGGGWSFLNACTDRHGDLWTGLQLMAAKLLALGEAAGFVICQMPRDLWEALPGGVPYYAIDDRGWPTPEQDWEEPF